MTRIYASAATSGSPSPGGLGLTFSLGAVNTLERQQTLPRTTPLLASAAAVCEAVRLTPAGQPCTITCDNPKLVALAERGGQVRHPALQDALREIRDLIHQRGLTVQWVYASLGSGPELQRAHDLAQDAMTRAWETHNSPACPRCGGEMRVQSDGGLSRWVCRDDNCFQTLQTYTPE